jgi:hypothetical protein
MEEGGEAGGIEAMDKNSVFGFRLPDECRRYKRIFGFD